MKTIKPNSNTTIRVYGVQDGQKISKLLEKQTIVQVRKAVRTTGNWEGIAVGNKVATMHFISGWHLGVPVKFTKEQDVDNYAYNALVYLDRQLGDRIAFYKEIETCYS